MAARVPKSDRNLGSSDLHTVATPEAYAELFGMRLEAVREMFKLFPLKVQLVFNAVTQPSESNEQQLDRLRKLLVFTPKSECASTDDIIGDLNRLVEAVSRPMRVEPNYVRIGEREFVDGVEVKGEP